MAPKFFTASGDAYLLSFTRLVRAFLFESVKTWMAPHYQACVPHTGLTRQGRGWNSLCNEASLHHVQRLIEADEIASFPARDRSIIPIMSIAESFDSTRLSTTPVRSLASWVLADLDKRDAVRGFYTPAIHARTNDAIHAANGQEFTNSQLALSTFPIALRDEGLHAELRSWQLLPIPTTVEDYRDHYEGDAIYKSGNETIIVCSPWIDSFWNGAIVVEDFLQRLFQRLHGTHFKLISLLGFRAYRKTFRRLPWES